MVLRRGKKEVKSRRRLDDRSRDWTDVATSKECWKLLEAGRGKNQILLWSF